MKQYFVYIMASHKSGTIYIGMTNNLARRDWQHKNDTHDGFTKHYQVHRLVYCEAYKDVQEAIRREKRLKKWNRAWKIELIEQENPDWEDLSLDF